MTKETKEGLELNQQQIKTEEASWEENLLLRLKEKRILKLKRELAEIEDCSPSYMLAKVFTSTFFDWAMWLLIGYIIYMRFS